ncbi:MAG: hypothetical protein AAF467_24645 [Actinomycetota bacterium]
MGWPAFGEQELLAMSARLHVAVTDGFELARLDRLDDPAGEVLFDQLTPLGCGTAAEVAYHWPTLRTVEFADDAMIGVVVGFCRARSNWMRSTAFEMAATHHAQRSAA